MNKRASLTLKSFLITSSLILMFVLMLKIFNENHKKLNGEGIDVFLTLNSVCLKTPEAEYYIEPDKESLLNVYSYVNQHPAFVPFPLGFGLFSRYLLNN